MRKRFDDRIRKALRIASAIEPKFVRECHKLERPCGGLAAALLTIVGSRNRLVHERVHAAELLTLSRAPLAFQPILDQFLDCDGRTAWDIATALPGRLPRFTLDPAAITRVLRHDPDPERRSATARFLATQRVPGRVELLLSVLADRNETAYVRGSVAESLTLLGHASAASSLTQCFSDPDPVVRFWCVFALGVLATHRPHLHAYALSALLPMVEDQGEMPNYWSVGREAQAMVEYFDPEARLRGEQERAAILADPNSPPDLQFWAKAYAKPADTPLEGHGSYIEARYRTLCWRRFNQKD